MCNFYNTTTSCGTRQSSYQRALIHAIRHSEPTSVLLYQVTTCLQSLVLPDGTYRKSSESPELPFLKLLRFFARQYRYRFTGKDKTSTRASQKIRSGIFFNKGNNTIGSENLHRMKG